MVLLEFLFSLNRLDFFGRKSFFLIREDYMLGKSLFNL